MGKEAGENGLHDSSCDMLEAAVELAEAEIAANVDFSWLFEPVQSPEVLRKVTDTAKKVHDHHLDKRGMKSRTHRSHQYPYDKKLRKKKKFKKAFSLEEPILSREKLEFYQNKAQDNDDYSAKLNFASEVQMDELCRGKQLRVRVHYHPLFGVVSDTSFIQRVLKSLASCIAPMFTVDPIGSDSGLLKWKSTHLTLFTWS